MRSDKSSLRAGTYSRRELLRFLGVGAAIGAGRLVPVPAFADGANHPSIADFLGAQGSETTFVPPQPDQFGWLPAAPPQTVPPTLVPFALMDYCGFADGENLLNGILGTTTAGSVTERTLADGSTQVNVVLHTKRALAWAINIDYWTGPPDQFNANPLLFGYRVQDLLADIEQNGQLTLTPALAECHLEVQYVTSPGDPVLPDLVWGTYQFYAMKFRGVAFGPLRPASGVTDGTPGSCLVSQTGEYKTGILYQHHGSPVADNFPAEFVKIQTVGS